MRFIVVSLFAVALLSNVWFWYKPELPKIQAASLNQYTCSIAGVDSADTFNVLVMMPTLAIDFAETLCNVLTHQSDYSQVKITWRERALPSVKELLTSEYDLLWNRAYLINGLISNIDDLYTKLGDSPGYGSYWVSTKKKFPLSSSELMPLSIGLYDNQMSRAGYLLPIRNLTEMVGDIEQLDIRYYPSYQTLHDALMREEVDLIATFDKLFLEANQDQINSQIIAQNIPIGAWFLNKQLRDNNELICKIANSLSIFSSIQFDLANYPKGCASD